MPLLALIVASLVHSSIARADPPLRALRVGFYTGAFGPPHEGHVAAAENVRRRLGLDVIYVIPNIETSLKPNSIPYEHRRAMTALAFSGTPGVRLSDPAIERAFRANDRIGVINEIRRRHPDSPLFQIMGNDSFERFSALPNRPHFNNLTAVVLPRERGELSAVVPPRLTDGTPVIQLPPPIDDAPGAGLSSTIVRRGIGSGRRPQGLSVQVWDYINHHGLYGATPVRSPAYEDCVNSTFHRIIDSVLPLGVP